MAGVWPRLGLFLFIMPIYKERMVKAVSLKERITRLYEGKSKRADHFRYGLLAADLFMVLYLIGSSFFYRHPAVLALDVVFGLYLLLDYMARLWIARAKFGFILHPLNLADAVALISFITPMLGLGFGFLRVLRILRLMRSYRLLARLRRDFPFFQRNEDIINSSINLFIFVFIMTEIVLVTQIRSNPNVTNFLDAMYFTIAALTTTGFGDVTLQGDAGRLVSIVVMVFGVSLFLRLMQTIFRPGKVRFGCTQCGLYLHEPDAVHCKHCGHIVNIPNAGHI